MKVREFSGPGALNELRPAWNSLLQESASATTFLSWEWMVAWSQAYGNPDDLRILAAADESGEIRAIAPLQRCTIRAYNQTFRALRFVGDGSNDSDYLDFIVRRGAEPLAIRAFLAHLEPDLQRGLVLQLSDIPGTSPNLPLLRTGTETAHVLSSKPVPCATVSLPETWDAYLGLLRPRFRTKVRSVLRNLSVRPDIQFGFCTSEEDIERLLLILFELHTRRWNHDGKPGVFGSSEKRRFYADLSRRLLAVGTLRFSWLSWRNRILACQYGFRSGDTYLHLQEGYEPASEHWNVGMSLRAWSIAELQREGVREYDFLGGVGRHKTDWAATVKESHTIIVAAATYRNLLLSRAPVWEERLKDRIKRVIPGPVLVALRNSANVKSTPHSAEATRSAAGPIRGCAAKMYFGLGLPALVRPLRERYQLAPRAGGLSRRRSWARRNGPSGRILIYHRVNDDQDPFFPSTPVDVFDRHVRFVSRHYRVVALATLLDHLENGGPETVVTITFDDGYRDNRENAFPILERYGVSASIFLATGSIDSQEPLWFECLAHALKTTSMEFLDLEVDVPTRYWLRTTDERLRANTKLFALLRQMPDDERQARLREFLNVLKTPDSAGRRDAMLTWDNVRELHRRGIDFGGHTVTHPYLSRLTPDATEWEVTECKRRIEDEVQSPVSHFAYPNGREDDFTASSKALVRAAGYRAAVTTVWGLNHSSTDRMELRRGGAWEQDESLFAIKMDWYHLVND